MQRTIEKELVFQGTGLHTGAQITVKLRPSAAGTGIQFIRADLGLNHIISAKPQNVLDTKLATRLGANEASSISTTEHLMAALYGFGIDNIIVEVYGPELPILDGSAAPFLALLDEAGISEIKGSVRKAFVIRETIECVDPQNPSRFIRIEPSKNPEIHYAIDFGAENPIGMQTAVLELNGFSFCQNFSFARTFCFSDEVETMKKMGLARGGSLENAIVVNREKGREGILNQKGLRDRSEFVKHKVLDCIGDMMLVGAPVIGRIVAHKAGHDLHTQLAALILQAEANLSSRAVEVVREASTLPAFSSLLRFPKSLGEISLGTPKLVVG